MSVMQGLGLSAAEGCPPPGSPLQAPAPPYPAPRLVGAVRAPKLLDGLVCAPGQLQSDVAAPPLVLGPAVGLQEGRGRGDRGAGMNAVNRGQL